jgi:hypothetical protein
MKIRLPLTILLAALALGLTVITSADGITKRLKFARGKSSATVSGAVLRGDLDTYIVGAKSGQMMYTKITSLENNAVFSIKGLMASISRTSAKRTTVQTRRAICPTTAITRSSLAVPAATRATN